MSEKTRSIWPPTRSVTASAPPLYGTWMIFVFVTDLNTSLVTCEVVPTPPEPAVRRSGLARASAISCATLVTGTEGCTTSTMPALATSEIGVNSAGSQLSFL